MKKRILGLALALILVVSLLPMTTFAATPRPRFEIEDPNGTVSSTVAAGTVYYVTFEDVLNAEGTEVIGNKAVLVAQDATAPTTNYIKFEFVDGVFQVTFNNVNYRPTAAANINFEKATTDSYTREFNTVVTLVGENHFTQTESNNSRIIFSNSGNVTFTGSGSIAFDAKLSSGCLIQKKNSGDFIIQDTTFNMTLISPNAAAGIIVQGNIIFDGANVNIVGNKATCLVVGTAYRTLLDDTTKGITIQKGANVTLNQDKGVAAAKTNGKIVVNSATFTANKASSNNDPVFLAAPYVTGCSSVQYGVSLAKLKNMTLEGGTTLTTDHQFNAFKAIHECVASEGDDGDCTTAVKCACGKVMTPAKEHIAGTKTDCTKNTPCGNEGCTKDFAQDALAAHVPGEDDNNCATPVKCTNPGCEADAIEAKAHELKEGTYTCDQAHPCKNCGENYRNAGEHVGGGTEATCQKKAVCSCGQEYGELGACKPEADDGDCTTAVKCSVCGKETKAAEKAHKYTDKNDTTCDNEGCKNTRKVEGTENPKTGDNTALVLMVSLMAAAAAAFVCTKKFAR